MRFRSFSACAGLHRDAGYAQASAGFLFAFWGRGMPNADLSGMVALNV
jgi:hypothetical protein